MTWTTSSFSDGGANCVMVGRGAPGVVGLRDSKFPSLPAIVVSAEAWTHFADFLLAAPVDHCPIEAIPQDKTDLYQLDLAGATWISAPKGLVSDRVQMASLPGGAVALRHPADGATLRYTRAEWIAFMRGLNAGEFATQAAA
ncbi:DUF397 domain-containing protein [Sphaerimonospora cavernae]|uniref:DUF397 domain-containing protein n=1 Tax=Sphaerimonospora cavernae TaxID=1740611 RepID=A0ABV6U9I5_9ACTN